jgi:hypothetical protein
MNGHINAALLILDKTIEHFDRGCASCCVTGEEIKISIESVREELIAFCGKIADEEEKVEGTQTKVIRVGQTFQSDHNGLLQFLGFDNYMGERTIKVQRVDDGHLVYYHMGSFKGLEFSEH